MNYLYRQKIRKKIKDKSKVYQTARTAMNIYSKFLGPFHVLPDFLIIGAPRSGTSSLYHYLTQHPSIFSCKIKEPNYFAMYYYKNTGWYKSFFPTIWEKNKHKQFVTGEASTQYYWYPHVPKRVKKLLPDVKLILLMRNPTERSFSQFQMEVRHGHEKLSFEDAIKNEKVRTSEEYQKIIENENYFSPKYTMYAYLEKSIYVNYVEEWLKLFPRENFLFLNSENFYENPQKVVNRIFEFLQLPSVNVDTSKILKKYTFQKINPETRKQLSDYFKPFNERLYSLIGENFNWR